MCVHGKVKLQGSREEDGGLHWLCHDCDEVWRDTVPMIFLPSDKWA